MKTKTSLISLLAVFLMATFAFGGCNNDHQDNPTIRVTSVEFIPNSFARDGEIVGMDTDIAREAMQKAGVNMEMGLSSSAEEAFNSILKGPNRAMVNIGYSPDRKDLYKWAGPTSQGIYGIFENGDSDIKYPLPIDEAKKITSIAVVRNWLETTTLEKLGFPNLKYYDSYNEALNAFMTGEARFIASDFFHLVSTLPAGYFVQNVSTVTRYLTVFNYIAFSKDVSDEVVERVQDALNSLIEDQRTASILLRYFTRMPTDYIPGTIQLFTEDAPPFNYGTGSGVTRKVEGSSLEIVNKIQEKSGYINKSNLSTWIDAYAIPQYLPNSAVYDTARTPERENMFQWVGPISTHRTYFYTLANSGITIDTLEQAKSLQSVATPKGWYTQDFLASNGFGNIVTTALTPQEAFSQLVNGQVEALLLSDLHIKWVADNAGVSMSQLTQHMEAMDFDGYIAFSLNTPAKTVKLWQNNLNAMKRDGSFEAIWNKWYEGIPLP